MPSCMGFFTASIRIEKRGSVGGIVLLLSGIGLFAFGIISIGNIFLQTIILTGWRLVGLSFFVFPKTSEEETKMVQAPSYKSLVGQRPFILYIVPWIMFSLISYLTIPMQTALIGESQLIFLTIVESFLGGIFSIVGGFFADRIGRKRIAILGFASLGLGYSVLGIFPQQLFGWYFYTVVDGVALGLLYVIFVVTIWGDLSHDSASDKYYALGVLPFFVSQFLQLIIGKDILAVISPSAIFSFAAFFLFMAVLPLVYAPETLPEKLMKDRDLKSYAEKALKQAQKDSGKTHKKESAKAEKESGETKESEETPEDEEARKLAEKYY